MRDVSASDVREILREEPGAVVIDVLSRDSFEKQHVPGSINVPNAEPDFMEQIEKQVPSKRTPVVLYCAGPACPASPQAARRLEAAGYQDVREFRGGLEEWQESGYAFEGAR